jgi:hypothetical protein
MNNLNKNISFQLRKTVNGNIKLAALIDRSGRVRKFYIFEKKHRDLSCHPRLVQNEAAKVIKQRSDFKTMCSFDVKFKTQSQINQYINPENNRYWFQNTYLKERINLRKKLGRFIKL